jgi:hypothetical protein
MQNEARMTRRAFVPGRERQEDTVSTQRASLRRPDGPARHQLLTPVRYAARISDLLGDFSEQTGAFFG